MTLRRLSVTCILAAAMMIPAPLAFAQMGLPRDLVISESIGGGQAEAIDRYVSDWLPRLASDDPLEIRRVRDNLLTPLRERGVSVAFRQAYAERMLPGLVEHARDERDLVNFNALRVAGELAVPGAIDLLRDKMRDSQPSVRYGAVYGMKRVFGSVREQSPAIGSGAVQQLITELGRHLENERQPEILDAGIRALALAHQIDRPNFSAVRAAAFSTLMQTSGKRARSLEGGPEAMEMLRVLLRAGQIARDSLSVQNPQQYLGERGVREAAELSGHMLAYVVRRLQAGDFPHGDPEARSLATQVVTLAETSIVLAARMQQAPNLTDDFSRASSDGDRAFFAKSVDLLGGLTRAPFNFPAGHFLGG